MQSLTFYSGFGRKGWELGERLEGNCNNLNNRQWCIGDARGGQILEINFKIRVNWK
jgi:hypothetical protein